MPTRIKTKDIILGSTALLCAMIASLALSFRPSATIHVVPLGESEAQCIEIDEYCNEWGMQTCQILVMLPNASTAYVPAYDPYATTECTVVLRDNHPTPNLASPILVEEILYY